MTTGDIVVAAIIAAMAVGAILVLWYNHRKGKNNCGCNCSGCPGSKTCKTINVKIDDDETCECCNKK